MTIAREQHATITRKSAPIDKGISWNSCQERHTPSDRVNKFSSQAAANRFLFGEFADHEEIDFVAKRLGNDNCGLS
ncbi:hypothetical protein BEL01nite_63770 [Bradyrhizobium elkanii]|nr:hypothetical protein BEL01nite_63770 [Bradyrhizobium elkanii]